MRRFRLLLTGSVLLILPSLVAGQAPERNHDIELEDYFGLAFITSIEPSPDGRFVAYTEMRWEPENDARNTDLWQVDTESGRITRLTFDSEADTDPKWSADGQWIYFLSARTQGEGDDPPYNGKKQVWRVAASGGSIFPVTRLARGVQAFTLSRNGESLYYTTSTEEVDEDHWRALRQEFDELEYGHGVVDFSELWKVDLSSWRGEKLIDEKRVIGAFAVSPDEHRIAMVTTPTQELITNEGWSAVDVYDRTTGRISRLPDRQWREEAPSPYGWIVSPTWSSDGRALAFRVDFDGYPAEVFVARFDGDGEPVIRKIERPNEVSVEGRMAWLPGTDDLCFIAEERARSRVYRIAEAGLVAKPEMRTLTPGDVVIEQFGFSDAGERMVVLMRDPRHAADLYVMPTDGRGEYRRVTSINPQVERWKLPQVRVVSWTSADGTAVEGILELPPDYEDGDGPLPLVVEIHGGPTASTKYAFQFWIYGRTLFAARGWALLSPNYRGSTGYGDRFLTDLIGNKNNLDVADILSGVDMLIAEGIADPDRLAVMGWSNGGYLTNCLITTTDRFKAASSGAGVFDTVMQWSIEDTPGHVINFSRGLPWTNPQRMHEASPLYNVDKVVTPTLIHVGEKDERVPAEHSKSLYRALHHYLKVPTELVIYPGTGHGLQKYSHRKAKMKWDVEWFDFYVLGKSAEEDAKSQGGAASDASPHFSPPSAAAP